jgi:hypothetical protein
VLGPLSSRWRYFRLDPEDDLGADDRPELDRPELDRPALEELRPDEPDGARPTDERLGEDDLDRPTDDVGFRVDGLGADVVERRVVEDDVRGTITGREPPVVLRVEGVVDPDGVR